MPNQPKRGRLTDHGRKNRPGATPEQMRHALTGVFMGFDGGKLWSTNSAANRVGGVTLGPLQRAAGSVCVLLRKGGFE
jgi:hypothetical protein